MSKEKQTKEMRKDLIEIFDEEYEKRRLITADFTAIKLTAKGYRKQEWISVDDRLPEKYEKHLLLLDNGRITIGWYHESAMNFVEDGFVTVNRVTHWMPIPEPPKMKGGAE